jgi:hypothetical protein
LTTQLIVLSDLHINSTVAVCPPRVQLDDGGTYHASRTQQWLWACLNDIIAQALEIQADKRVLVLNGDLGELDTKKRSIQLVTLNKATILGMVIDTLEPLLAVTDATYIVRGTPAHEGKSCWLETQVGADIDAVPDPRTGAPSWWHIRSACEDVRLDIAHHASMGSRWWSKANAVLSTAASMEIDYMIGMEQNPKLRIMQVREGSNLDSHALKELERLAIEHDFQIWIEKVDESGKVGIVMEDGEITAVND